MAMSQWWSFTENFVRSDRDEPGVYELGDVNRSMVYIGSTIHIRTRLGQHLAGGDPCIDLNARYYRIDYRHDYVAHERERLLDFQRTHGRLPHCNDRIP